MEDAEGNIVSWKVSQINDCISQMSQKASQSAFGFLIVPFHYFNLKFQEVERIHYLQNIPTKVCIEQVFPIKWLF